MFSYCLKIQTTMLLFTGSTFTCLTIVIIFIIAVPTYYSVYCVQDKTFINCSSYLIKIQIILYKLDQSIILFLR